MDSVTLIGLTGMALVFASFTVKRWAWLYSFNMSGAIVLAVYAAMRGDPIFVAVEAGLAAFLAHKLYRELSSRR